MSTEFFSKHVRLTQTHIDILDKLIGNKPGITNYADAIRYTILALEDPVATNGSDRESQRKINAMSKNIDIIKEMVAGGFHSQNVRAIGNAEETYIYQDAERIVEGEIQKATTKKQSTTFI